MSEKKLTDMTEKEMLAEAEKLKKEADTLLAAAMRIENALEHDYITPEEEMKCYAEIFKKSQELNDKKTEMVAEAKKKNYRKVLELLKFYKAVE